VGTEKSTRGSSICGRAGALPPPRGEFQARAASPPRRVFRAGPLGLRSGRRLPRSCTTTTFLLRGPGAEELSQALRGGPFQLPEF